MKKRGFIVGDYLAWWILAIAGMIIALIVYMLLSGKGVDALEYLKQIVRYGP
jgi:hypothetical protein